MRDSDEETKGSSLPKLRASPDANWKDWAFDLEMRAMAKKEGETTLWTAMQPSADQLVTQDAQNAAFGLIGSRLDVSLFVVIREARDAALKAAPPRNIAKAAYEALQLKFEGIARTQSLSLSRQWQEFRMEKDENVMQTFNRFRSLKSQLEAVGSTYSEGDIWITITKAFAGTKYERLCDNATSTSRLYNMDMPKLEDFESALTAEEQRLQHSTKGAPRISSAALATEAATGANSHDRGRGRRGRGRGGGGRGGGRGRGRGSGPQCWTCGEFGHMKKDCPTKQDAGGDEAMIALVVDSLSSSLAATSIKHDGLDPDIWCWDSGTVENITPFLGNLQELRWLKEPSFVTVGGGEAHAVLAVGCSILETIVDGRSSKIRLKEVNYVPTFKHQLMTTRPLHQPSRGMTVEDVEISSTVLNQYLVVNGQRKAMAVWRKGHLPRMRATAVKQVREESATLATNRKEVTPTSKADFRDAWELHDAVGHPSHRVLADALSKQLLIGTDVKASTVRQLGTCGPCLEGKMKRVPFGGESSEKGTWGKAEFIHLDYCGPLSVSTPEGYNGFFAMTDDYSHLRVVTLLRGKNNHDVMKAFHRMLALMRNQGTGTAGTLKALRIDSGRELLTSAFEGWCAQNGIILKPTATHSSQQNGVAESTNRLLMEKVRVQLAASKLPKSMWGHILMASTMQLNRLPCSSNPGDISPYERFWGKKPSVTRFKPLGSEAFIMKLPRYKSGAGKLDTVSEKGRLVGYSIHTGTMFFLLSKGRIVRSRDVRWAKGGRSSDDDDDDGEDDSNTGEGIDGGIAGSESSPTVLETPPLVEAQQQVDGAVGAEEPEQSDDDSSDDNSDGSSDEDSGSNEDEAPQQVRRSSRVRKATQRYSPSLVVMASDVPTPRNTADARNSPYAGMWMDAEQAELQSLKDNGVMQPIGSAPPGAKVISTMMIYKPKSNSDGTLERCKARLVAKGFQQTPEEAGETYAPTGSLSVLRSALSYAAREDLEVDQMDFKTAFLQAPLKEDVYIKLPSEFAGEKRVIYKLNRAIYGLKQAPRAWYDTLRSGLEDIQLIASDADAALFVLRGATPDDNVLIWCHVDDVLVIGRSGRVAAVKQRISERFDVNDLGPAHYLLGMEITRDRKAGTIKLSQPKYAGEVLERFGMQDSKQRGGPADKNSKLIRAGEQLSIEDAARYRSMVGSLMYLAVCTRPDLSQTVGALGRFLSCPTEQHMVAAKHALRYLVGTKEMGIIFGVGKRGIRIYSDSDYAGDLDTRRSTTGYVVTMDGAAISWSSKLQPTVAVSTQEAEYMAQAAAAREALLLRKVFSDFGMPMTKVCILSDNQAAISLAANPMVQARSKHIDIQHHFVRDRISRGEISISYIPTSSMIADLLTKPLHPINVKKCRDGMGVM